MSNFDDLPQRDKNRQIQEQSENAFLSVISDSNDFVVQSEDKRDYGTDYQIEANDAGSMTNVRVHVQLKGTGREKNGDDSISLSVRRSNLNYLAMQCGSIYVCYHVPTERLLTRSVDDVIREYEHRNSAWTNQTSVTVRFRDRFDQAYLQSLRAYAVVSARGERDKRLYSASTPPDSLYSPLDDASVDFHVPAEKRPAEQALVGLYDRSQDRAISRSFPKFHAILGPSNSNLLLAYMAEINLGLNGQACDRSRISDGIEALRSAIDDGAQSAGSLFYCIGNGWLALDEPEKAVDAYHSALNFLDQSNDPSVAGRCCKNLGSAMQKLNDSNAAYDWYTKALVISPELAEAHFALAQWSIRNGSDGDLDRALEHLDAIVWTVGTAETLASAQGWRAEILFRQEKVKEWFREINALLSKSDQLDWVWPWCARLVSTYGRTSVDAAQASVRFWDRYLNEFGDDQSAKRERLLGIYLVRQSGLSTGVDYNAFKEAVAELAVSGEKNASFLWDRAGHWAQGDGEWIEAEQCYRKAFDLSPHEFGYCLGTSLNFLGRHAEALPVLLEQANEHHPDAMSWFQVAVARQGVANVEGSIEAYKRALILDENYELAWFNLGGVYWNNQRIEEAINTWNEAIERFPSHELSLKLRNDSVISDLLNS